MQISLCWLTRPPPNLSPWRLDLRGYTRQAQGKRQRAAHQSLHRGRNLLILLELPQFFLDRRHTGYRRTRRDVICLHRDLRRTKVNGAIVPSQLHRFALVPKHLNIEENKNTNILYTLKVSRRFSALPEKPLLTSSYDTVERCLCNIENLI